MNRLELKIGDLLFYDGTDVKCLGLVINEKIIQWYDKRNTKTSYEIVWTYPGIISRLNGS